MNKVLEISKEENNFIKILKGYIVSVIITLTLIFIFSVFLTFSNFSENIIEPVVIAITGISIFLGSQIGLIKLRRNGLVNGGIIGVIYIASIYIVSSLVSGNFGINMYSTVMIIISIVAGMLGGIVGLNMRHK